MFFIRDDVYYYNCWRLELEGETESICVCTKERRGVSAGVLMATPCTNSLGGESGEQKHEGCGGRSMTCDVSQCISALPFLFSFSFTFSRAECLFPWWRWGRGSGRRR